MADNGNTDPRTLPALAAAFADMTAARTAPEAIRSMTFKVVKKGFDQGDVTAYLDRLAADVELLHNRIKQLEAKAAEAPAPSAFDRAMTLEAWAAEAPAPSAFDQAMTLEAPALELDLPGPPGGDGVAGPSVGRDGFDEVAGRIAELMRAFEDDVRAAEESARSEAEAAVAKARAEADEIRLEARLAREEAVADAAAIVASARADADRLGRDAQMRAEELEASADRTVREARSRADEILRAMTLSRDGLVGDIREMRETLLETLTRMDAVIAGRDADRVVVVEDSLEDDATTR